MKSRTTRTVFAMSLIGAAAAVSYACIGEDPDTSPSTAGDGATGDATTTGDGDGSSTTNDGAPSCEGVDLQNDAKNCGACGKTCADGFACKAGVCDSAVALLGSGERHACAALQRGDLYCWGRNSAAQLGTGAPSENAPPTLIPRDSTLATIAGLTSFALGEAHSCALRTDGTMLCWGSDQYGQLSNNHVGLDGGQRIEPVPFSATMKTSYLDPLELRFKELAHGPRASHACAVTGDGGAYCWGFNQSAQANFDAGVGIDCGEQNTTRCVPLPAPIAVSGAKSIAVGLSDSCVVRDDGSVACWGSNVYGQLGNGARSLVCIGPGPACARPAEVAGLPGPAEKVAIGAGTACALLGDKTVWCWGNNTDDLLGFAHATDAGDQCCNIEPGCTGGQYCRVTPVQRSGVTDAVDVALGGAHACVLHEDSTVSCWGANDSGQLGNGLLTPSATPVKVVDLPPVSSIAAGVAHTCARTKDGRVFCWGLNDSGQIGSGTANANKPVQVPLP